MKILGQSNNSRKGAYEFKRYSKSGVSYGGERGNGVVTKTARIEQEPNLAHMEGNRVSEVHADGLASTRSG
jgi:hypothetical protein